MQHLQISQFFQITNPPKRETVKETLNKVWRLILFAHGVKIATTNSQMLPFAPGKGIVLQPIRNAR